MTALTLYGAVAVTAMLLFYTLEARARIFVLAFAAACLASSAYGLLQGAWPFAVVEAIWSVVALRRWRSRDLSEDQAAAVSSAARDPAPGSAQ